MKKALAILVLLATLFTPDLSSSQTANLEIELKPIIWGIAQTGKRLGKLNESLVSAGLQDDSDMPQISALNAITNSISETVNFCHWQIDVLIVLNYVGNEHKTKFYSDRIRTLKYVIESVKRRIAIIQTFYVHVNNSDILHLIDNAKKDMRHAIALFEKALAVLTTKK